ncbi:MAG: TauD/TfdA family dioxygenase [Pseudomonadales bacterium]
MKIRRLTPVIGAQVDGADLLALDDAGFAAIRQALTDHLVLFFRDQPRLEPSQQIDFAARFGPLHVHPAAPHLEGHPELFVIHAHKDSKVANGNGWHTDVSCDEAPPLATMLQLHTLPSCGGDTLFSSMYAAWETLSSPLRSFLETLSATHDSEHIYRGRYADRGVDDSTRTYPRASHPVARTHPDSGRTALYVNPSFTTRINELAREESQALLDYLFRHQQRPEFQVRFQWSENAIALWDNRCTQHFALWDYWPEERKGHRVTIRGERPYFDPSANRPAEARALRLSRQLA